MKPIVNIWIRQSALAQIGRDRFPSEWRRSQPNEEGDWLSINVTGDWFKSMIEYENKIASNDLPF